MKRFKIITTIASICLALAIMAFGVYAASSGSFTISQSVTYNCSDVFVNVTVAKTFNGSTTYDYGVSYTGTGNDRVPTALTVSNSSFVASSGNLTSSQTVAFTSSAKTATITITVANVNANKACKFKFSALPGDIGNTTKSMTYSVDGGTSTNVAADTFVTIPASKSAVITYTRTLSDTSIAVASGSGLSTTLTIADGAAS